MRKPKLTEEQIQSALTELPEWSVKDGVLSKTFAFPDFIGSIQFVIALAFKAEAANHHPDLDIRYNKVHVGLVTHDSGGITENDTALAKEAEKLK
jgi:4a-hydroxytetrahydrobiopterin dehydratase